MTNPQASASGMKGWLRHLSETAFKSLTMVQVLSGVGTSRARKEVKAVGRWHAHQASGTISEGVERGEAVDPPRALPIEAKGAAVSGHDRPRARLAAVG